MSEKTLIKHYTAVINAAWISISDPVEFFQNPVQSGSCSVLQNPVGSWSGNRIKFNSGSHSSRILRWYARFVKQKWNCQSVKKKQYFSLQLIRKQYKKRWKTCLTKQITLQCKTHLQNKKTTPQSRPTRLKISNFYPSFIQLSAHPTWTYLISPF